ncbi:hypothetical protein AHYW_001685 [Providencia manganoxydans]|uniref:helix-turn-helix domain-containing protein n=1 Tax=Providencia TaxID=586 RepID=UPI00111D2AF3|nr:helix-turn-helix domain-containing protein [Providencia stuartii]
MSKYNRNLKIAIANQYLSWESSEALSKIYDISSRQIRYWAQVVTIHGNKAFQPTPHLRCAKARLQAIKLMWTHDWSLGHTSAVLNLTTTGTLSLWLDRYDKYGFKGLECRSRGRKPMDFSKIITDRPDNEKTLEELKEEVAYLRAENAVLKKLEELEQIKRRQAKKKR